MAFHRLYQGFSLSLPYFMLTIVRILPVLVRIFVVTCTSGSVIFSNTWDFAVYLWTIVLHALSLPTAAR